MSSTLFLVQGNFKQRTISTKKQFYYNKDANYNHVAAIQFQFIYSIYKPKYNMFSQNVLSKGPFSSHFIFGDKQLLRTSQDVVFLLANYYANEMIYLIINLKRNGFRLLYFQHIILKRTLFRFVSTKICIMHVISLIMICDDTYARH